MLPVFLYVDDRADVLELVDNLDLKSSGLCAVRVRTPAVRTIRRQPLRLYVRLRSLASTEMRTNAGQTANAVRPSVCDLPQCDRLSRRKWLIFEGEMIE